MAKSKPRSKRIAVTDGSAPTREGTFELTGWRAVNWHNLLTQEQTVVGDVFNLGPNESGKTTLLDGIHFALTFGEPHMEWNSAADPNASESKLKREGRTLKDVIFRVNEHTQNDTPNIVYFAIELRNRRTNEVYTVAVGAYAASHEADVQKWGLILPKPLRDVRLVDEATGRVFDETKLEEEYGAQNVLQVRRFRQRMAELFFGSVDDYDQVIGMWKLGKSYNRLVHQSDNFAELFRRALPSPDPADFDSARSQLDTIRGIRSAIASITQQRNQLLQIESHQKEIQRQRAAIARYDLRDLTNELERAEHDHRDAQAAIDRFTQTLGELDGQEVGMRANLQQKEGLVNDLTGAGVDELSRAIQQQRQELDAALLRLNGASTQHDEAKTHLRIAAKNEESSWEKATAALQSANHVVERERGRVPEDAPAGMSQALQALSANIVAVKREAPELGDPFTDALDGLDSTVDQQREALRAAEQAAQTELSELGKEVARTRGQRDVLAAQRDVPPQDTLPRALAGIEDLVVATYAGIEVRPGREEDAALLEAYLPAEVLGAVIPLRTEDTERVKRHIQARAEHVKVVDTANLQARTLSEDAILHALDASKSHPLALAYVTSEYADVRVRDQGEPRHTDEHVIWRDGEVYDGHAWHLAHLEEKPRYLGKEARAANLKAQLDALDEKLRDLGTKTSNAKTRADVAMKKRELYTSIKTEVRAGITRARLESALRAVGEARVTLDAARQREEAQAAQVEKNRRDWEARRDRLLVLERESERTGAAEKIKTLTQTRAEVHQLHQDLEALAGTRGRTNDDLDTQRTKKKGADERIEDLTPKRRAQFEKLQAFLKITAPEVEAYLRENGFYRIKSTAQSKRDEASRLIGEAKNSIDNIVVELSAKRSLRFDFESNAVVESVGARPLAKVVDELDANLASRHLEDVEATRVLSEKIIVEGIAARIKDDVLDMRKLLDDVNENLKSVDFRGTRYKIQDVPVRDAKVTQIRNLILEVSAETSHENLAQFIQVHLEAAQPLDTDVPQLFDYRRWYDFRIIPTQLDPESEQKDRSAKGSGGRQAVPKYLFCFCLFSILYDRLQSRLRIVLIDEAFQRIDPGNIDQLIRFAKTRELSLIITNPDLDGATESMQASTVNMFHKNELNETFVQRWTRMATAVYARRDS